MSLRILVVYCHPLSTSLTHAAFETVLDALKGRRHEVRARDLYAEGFDPVLSAEERRHYHTKDENVPSIADHLADIRWAEALLFVYPTWWYGLPAMLKGWFDRVWVPHETFLMPEGNGPVRPNMTHIRHIACFSSHGSPWIWMRLVGEPGRRTILRGVAALAGPGCRRGYVGLYRIDTATRQDCERYLDRVRRYVLKHF